MLDDNIEKKSINLFRFIQNIKGALYCWNKHWCLKKSKITNVY